MYNAAEVEEFFGQRPFLVLGRRGDSGDFDRNSWQVPGRDMKKFQDGGKTQSSNFLNHDDFLLLFLEEKSPDRSSSRKIRGDAHPN